MLQNESIDYYLFSLFIAGVLLTGYKFPSEKNAFNK